MLYKRPSDQWPSEMPWLTQKDFIYGVWANFADKFSDLPDDAQDLHGEICYLSPEEIKNAAPECDTQCCLVGHVRHAFDLPAQPGSGGRLGVRGFEFLSKFVELAGGPKIENEGEASDFFEGIGKKRKALEPKEALRVWRKTLKHFDYTE